MEGFWLECIKCKASYELDKRIYRCSKDQGLLEVVTDPAMVASKVAKSDVEKRPLSVWRYREFIPTSKAIEPVTLEEGGTGLYRCKRLGKVVGIDKLYVKYEGQNPTGSFKDRGMTVGVTKALEVGAKVVACASTGNTSSSLAAYASRAGLRCLILVPKGHVAKGKLVQMLVHSPLAIQVEGTFDDCMEHMVKLAESNYDVYMLNSLNPIRLEGQKTAAFEICDQIKGVPDYVVVPMGSGSNIAALWKGFKEYANAGFVDGLPKMVGIQAEGASPIAKAFIEGKDSIEHLTGTHTLASAINIGKPANWMRALRALRESGGLAGLVTDDDILEAQGLLAKYEGVFSEPAGAASIAGAKRLVADGLMDKDATVVCVVTGHGLKDQNNVKVERVALTVKVSELSKKVSNILS